MAKEVKKKEVQKICSRGHKFKGPGPCPICYPGGLKKKKNTSQIDRWFKRN